MLNKINPAAIIADQIRTLRSQRSGKVNLVEACFFFVTPLVVAVGLKFLGFRLDGQVVTILLTAMSIFTALLFNLLVLLYDIKRRLELVRERHDAQRLVLIREVFANVSYSVLLAVIVVSICLLAMFGHNVRVVSLLIVAVELVVAYLTVAFLLTLGMVLKRIHVMFGSEFHD